MIRFVREAGQAIVLSRDKSAPYRYRYYLASIKFYGSEDYMHIVIDQVSTYTTINTIGPCVLGMRAIYLFESKVDGWGPTTLCIPLGLLDEIIIYESFDELPIDLFLIATGRILEKPLLKISDIYQYSGIVQ